MLDKFHAAKAARPESLYNVEIVEAAALELLRTNAQKRGKGFAKKLSAMGGRGRKKREGGQYGRSTVACREPGGVDLNLDVGVGIVRFAKKLQHGLRLGSAKGRAGNFVFGWRWAEEQYVGKKPIVELFTDGLNQNSHKNSHARGLNVLLAALALPDKLFRLLPR